MLCYAVIVLGIKLLPLVFAIAGSFRARFWLGLGIASVAVYCLVAATLRARRTRSSRSASSSPNIRWRSSRPTPA